MEEGLKVLRAEITNFKNIDYKVIDINGRSIVLTGPNQIGKSSLIQAICSPLNAKYIPLEPIKKGEERASVELTIGGRLMGETVKYTIACYFSPDQKRGRLVVHDKDGNPMKGGEKMFIDSLIGDISFDIMSFIRLGVTDTGRLSKEGVKKQIEILKALMPSDSIVSLNNLDEEKQTKYDYRTEVNRDIKYLKGKIDNAGFTQDEIQSFSAPMDVSGMMDELSKLRAENDRIDKAKRAKDDYQREVVKTNDEIKELQERIVALSQKLTTLKDNIGKCDKHINENKPHDLNILEQKISSAAEHNSKHIQVKELDRSVKELSLKSKESEEITKRLEVIENLKKEIFANASMPVKGLAFDEESVTYNGLPLSEEQLPTSVLIGIGLRIGMAINPNLKLLIIKDGSLLDKKTMNFILKTCSEKGYQLLIEKVLEEGNELSIDFIEN